jgi:hypothetical protein
VIYGI